MGVYESDQKIIKLGRRKIVYSEGDELRVRTIVGYVIRDGDFFIITTQKGDLWLNKNSVIALKGVDAQCPE